MCQEKTTEYKWIEKKYQEEEEPGEDYIRDTAKTDYPKQIRINCCICSEKIKVILPLAK
jgi:hypothetical protein